MPRLEEMMNEIAMLALSMLLILGGLGFGLLAQAVLNEHELARRDRAFDELRRHYASGALGD